MKLLKWLKKSKQGTLGDCDRGTGPHNFSSIDKPTIQAKFFEMKHPLLTLFQLNAFSGLSHEDPYEHLATFFQLCDTVKRLMQQTKEVIHLGLFPFSLIGRARTSLQSRLDYGLTN